MSLNIDTDKVTDVLLADGWHEVDTIDGWGGGEVSSFDLDAYEYTGDGLFWNGESIGCSTGFRFMSKGQTYYGPMTALLAVREGSS